MIIVSVCSPVHPYVHCPQFLIPTAAAVKLLKRFNRFFISWCYCAHPLLFFPSEWLIGFSEAKHELCHFQTKGRSSNLQLLWNHWMELYGTFTNSVYIMPLCTSYLVFPCEWFLGFPDARYGFGNVSIKMALFSYQHLNGIW